MSVLKDNDPIKPKYYYRCIKGRKVEVIDVIESWGLHREHCLASAVQYILRGAHKHTEDQQQDIKKAVWFLQRWLIEQNDEGELK